MWIGIKYRIHMLAVIAVSGEVSAPMR